MGRLRLWNRLWVIGIWWREIWSKLFWTSDVEDQVHAPPKISFVIFDDHVDRQGGVWSKSEMTRRRERGSKDRGRNFSLRHLQASSFDIDLVQGLSFSPFSKLLPSYVTNPRFVSLSITRSTFLPLSLASKSRTEGWSSEAVQDSNSNGIWIFLI